jgi:hypothetical protein
MTTDEDLIKLICQLCDLLARAFRYEHELASATR